METYPLQIFTLENHPRHWNFCKDIVNLKKKYLPEYYKNLPEYYKNLPEYFKNLLEYYKNLPEYYKKNIIFLLLLGSVFQLEIPLFTKRQLTNEGNCLTSSKHIFSLFFLLAKCLI